MVNESISEKYVKMEQKEHVLKRPGMYIGSIEKEKTDVWLVDKDGTQMVKTNIEYIPGLFKIYDEIVANAIDHSIRLQSDTAVNKTKNIKIDIDKETGIISVLNDGEGIEVVMHPDHKIYIPQLIFGNLLTSTNYNDEDERTVQGTNGIGCKACNIFSKWFELETVDAKSQKKYIQKWETNMIKTNKPSITKCVKKPYTVIRFLPDYEKFNLSNLSNDMYEVMRKRVYDICAVTNDINIWLNGEKLKYTFENYVNLYIGSKSEHARAYEKINDRWEVIASYNNNCGFEQISFVNGLLTLRGGKHVDYIVNQIVKGITEMVNKKHKDAHIKPQNIKDNLIVFIKCTIVNPTFNSQSKEILTTPVSKFGSKGELSQKFLNSLLSPNFINKLLQMCSITEDKILKKTDGKKMNIIRGLPKLEDALWAGTQKSGMCTLILTEGDSAASMAIAGLSEVGRDKYGVFPLKGKVMNVKDTTVKKIADNDEITNIKKILGLETGKVYTDVSQLRYGKIMLMTDSDVDGAHIKGLIFNLFHSLWPSLIKSKFEFMTSMLTPIIKASKTNQIKSFYNLTDYEKWKETDNTSGWKIKYYKGLGTSTDKEAKEYFRDMHLVKYKHSGNESDQTIDLGFNKKRADDRKAWISHYDKNENLNYLNSDVTYEDFINKELIHFSNYDLVRSIPNVIDGLKVSQRKILYSCFKRNLTTDEIRVAQLAGYVSEHSAYHHGEASLQSTIVGLAQTFVGSNNINILQPNGQFGSRLHGGKDAGQPRYIHTLLSPITLKLFSKQDNDVLEYVQDDGVSVEPEFYVPSLPMILVNGAIGIGTGFSTNIPCYNPSDIIRIIENKLTNKEISTTTELVPWYKNFKGKIKKIGENKYVSIGLFKLNTPTSIRITELPVGCWTIDYKIELEELIDKIPQFKSYENKSTDDIDILLHFTSKEFVDSILQPDESGNTKFENLFKLISTKGLTTSNMYAFNSKRQITKYKSPIEIINEYYNIRLEFYQKRKDRILEMLSQDVIINQNKKRFIELVISEVIKVHKMNYLELEKYLVDNKFAKNNNSFDYLTRIPIYNLTKDKVTELIKELSKLENNFKEVKGMSINNMWLNELTDLKKHL